MITSNMQIVSESRLDTPKLSILCTRMDVIVPNVNNRKTEPSTLSGMSITESAPTSGLLCLIAHFIVIRFTIIITNQDDSSSVIIRTELKCSQSLRRLFYSNSFYYYNY